MTEWQWSFFTDLSTDELYLLLQLRQEVFVVEQKCAYLDADGLDQASWHLLGWQEKERGRELVAYLRVTLPGKKYAEPAIGRLLTARSVRGTGIGKELTRVALQHLDRLYPDTPVRMSAQQYLVDFYATYGFTAVSAPYDEDGIPHVEMVRAKPRTDDRNLHSVRLKMKTQFKLMHVHAGILVIQ